MDQFVVFDGLKKQFIIGGLGSGKIELMKVKVFIFVEKLLFGKKILYLIYCDRKNVFFNVMRKFFNDNNDNKEMCVDVLIVELEGEYCKVFEDQ